MKTQGEVEKLEKIIGQLQGAHAEISILAKKAPADSLNAFKLTLINNVIRVANEVLGAKYKPFDQFHQFEADDLPSNSDVTMILAQYMEEAERYRSDNVVADTYDSWVYLVNGGKSRIQAGPPRKIGKK